MEIKIKVGPTTSNILKASTMVLSELANLCSYQQISDRAKKYSKACQGGWDGRVSLLNKFDGSVPTGLVPKIVRWLKDEGHNVTLEKSLPATVESVKMLHLESPPGLRDYQVTAVEKMVRNKRGILQLPTGAGKTETAVGLVGALKRPTIFFVHTKELTKQAQERFERYFSDIKIGTIGDSVIDPGLITIASIQTVSSWLIPPKEPKQKKDEMTTTFQARQTKYFDKLEEWERTNERAKKFLSKFAVAIFDECQHLAADTFFACAQACTGAEWLIALSATPWRDQGDELLIEAGSGSTIYALSLSDVVDMGYLVPAEIHIHEYPPLPPMNLSDVYAEQYKICITFNEHRNAKICEVVEQEYNQGRSVLVLCREIEHLNLLSERLESQGIACAVVHGKTKNRAQLLDRFKDQTIRVLLGSTIFDEGVDIPSCEAVILAGAGRSRVKSYQRIGRSLRPFPGKTKAIIHDFRDEVKPFIYHYQARMRLYKAEHCFKIVEHFQTRIREVVKKQMIISNTLEQFTLAMED
jgi:superfamily II DNA or RNA helicase